MDYRESVCVHENNLSNIFEWDHPVIRRGELFKFSVNEQRTAGFGSIREVEEIRVYMTVNGDDKHSDYIVPKLCFVNIENKFSHTTWKKHQI